MSNLTPASVSLPGEIIRAELQARNWSQFYLAQKMAIPLDDIIDLMTDNLISHTHRTKITKPIAVKLAKVFGTSMEFWINLERNYRKHLVDQP